VLTRVASPFTPICNVHTPPVLILKVVNKVSPTLAEKTSPVAACGSVFPFLLISKKYWDGRWDPSAEGAVDGIQVWEAVTAS
jgi:hypothetical protein